MLIHNPENILQNKWRLDSLMKQLIVLMCLAFSSCLWAGEKRVLDSMLTLFVGESRVIDAPDVKRLSVGKSDLISSTLLKSGEIVLIAEETGETNMQFWFADGHRETVSVVVVESNGWRQSLEVKALLEDIPGIEVTTVGRRIVIDGNLQARDLERVNTVKERYSDMLILAREISDFEQKMIYFDVQVTEINRDVTEEIGVNWSKSFAGPSVGYETAWKYNNLGTVEDANGNVPLGAGLLESTSAIDTTLGENVDGDLSLPQQLALIGAQGHEYSYWGISTSLVSMINMLEQTGSAITLAEPRLSARSGGTAALTVGGEVPVVTSSVSGQTVTYKDYGIILNIEPSLDMSNNIMARVSVAVSQLDLSNAVDGQPAFKKRFTENDIKLQPGETLALSGLITREEQIAYSGLKWLSSIPVLGNLFKSKSFTSGETELVILITPRVIADLAEGVNQQLVDRAKELVVEFEEKVDSLME